MEPSFERASLNLGGKIGMNLFKNTTEDLYGFTCYVNSIQMADDIQAVFHYMRDGNEMTVSGVFTIESYIHKLVNSDECDEAKNLGRALNDFGYYTQRYLSVENGFSIDGENPDHKPMAGIFGAGYEDADANRVQAAIGTVLPIVQKSEDISNLGMSLVLDSDTGISVTFNVAPDYSGEVTATIDDSPVTITRTNTGKYKVAVNDIGPNMLADRFSIAITTADSTDLSVSALDYVGIGLQNINSQEQRDTLIAIYDYYQATVAYVDSLSD